MLTVIVPMFPITLIEWFSTNTLRNQFGFVFITGIRMLSRILTTFSSLCTLLPGPHMSIAVHFSLSKYFRPGNICSTYYKYKYKYKYICLFHILNLACGSYLKRIRIFGGDIEKQDFYRHDTPKWEWR
jgi:hypothetical protein